MNLRETREVVDWKVIEYHDTILVMAGYNEDDEEVVRRHYELQTEKTELKTEDGEWIPLNDIDNGGFPLTGVFTAFEE